MTPAKWSNIKEILSAALDLPERERDALLGGEPDAEIRREVARLLAAHAKSADFIARPLVDEYGLRRETAEDDLAGRAVGDYLIVEKIGEGGMGAVFRAERRGENFRQTVALKLIKRGMDTNAVLKRFLMERQILAQLEHPFIARLLDAGSTADGRPFFVMEYVEGETIKKFCESRALGTRARLELFGKVCRAVAYAHQKLIVHRDLKPSNILVTETGEPKLLDFGIAKLLSPDWSEAAAASTATGSRLMTPEYASPEQLRGRPTTVSTDVYSLGVVLYELLTGARPYDLKSKNPFEAAAEILTNDPPAPSSIVAPRRSFSAAKGKTTNGNQLAGTAGQSAAPDRPQPKIQNLKGDLDNIILKAIRKEPEERYASVQELAEDVRRHLGGLPVAATADSLVYRFSKFVGRHRIAAAATALAALVICSLSGLSIYYGAAATRERDKAEQRYNKLRDVAKLLMSETRDSLAKVPGTIEVQRKLAEKSVDLLDSIDDETTTDTAFLAELAGAYEKLGRTRLWNFREFEKSRLAYERAREIRRRIVALAPGDRRRAAEYFGTVGQLTEVFSLQGDREQTLRLLAEIIDFERRKVDLDPSDENLASLAMQLFGTAETLNKYEMPGESRRFYEEARLLLARVIEASGGRELAPAEKTDLAWNLMLQAEALLGLGREDEAFDNFSRAAELAESAYRADDTLQYAFNHTSRAHRRLGEFYEKRGDYRKALEMYRFSFEWLRARQHDSSQIKANLYFGVFFFANRCALMLARLGRQDEADRLIEKPLREYSAFLDAEENAASLVYAREPLLDLTRYYAQTGRFEKAAELWRRNDERLQKFLDKNADDLGFLNGQIESQKQLGEIYSAYDEKSDSFKTVDAVRLRKARFHYEKAAALRRRAQSVYEPTGAEREELRKIERKIERLSRPELF